MRIRSLELSAVMAVLAAAVGAGPTLSQEQSICALDKSPLPVVQTSASSVIPPLVAVPTETVVRDLERDEKGFPKWSNFPAAPQNIPTASDFKQRVSDIKVREYALEAAVARLIWDEGDPETFSAAARSRLNADLSRPVTKNSCNEINQFAIANRAKAVPPPSADR